MLTIMYGRETDHSLVGDWDGDGVDTPGVFRGGPPLKAAGECAPLNAGRSRYTTDNANRVSLVIAERYGTSYAKFVNCHKQWDGSYYEEWQTPTRIGANGMATVGEPAAGIRTRHRPAPTRLPNHLVSTTPEQIWTTANSTRSPRGAVRGE